MLLPNPKSNCMAPSVAVGWEIESSNKLSIAGSNVERELQSRGLVVLGEETGEVTTEELDANLGSSAVSSDLIGILGAVNVKEDCLRATFSPRSRVSKSRRFSFSFSVCSFFASSSATLSSSYV